MTDRPWNRKLAARLWKGLAGMPLALRLNEGLGFTRVRQKRANSLDRVFTRPFWTRQIPFNTVFEKVERFMIHVMRVRRLRRAVSILAVAVAVPCIVEATPLVLKDACIKRNDSQRVSFVCGSQEVHVVDVVPGVCLGGCQFGSEGVSELRGGGVESAEPFSAGGQSVSDVNANNPDNRDPDWYVWLYSVLAVYPIVVAGMTGCFRTAGGYRSDHVKPNVRAKGPARRGGPA